MSALSRWLIPGLLGLQAAFLGSTFGTLFACLFLYVLFFAASSLHSHWRRQTDHSKRSNSAGWLRNTLLYLFIAIGISAWRFSDYAGESINPIAFGFDAGAHTALVSALCLWALHPVAGHPAMLALGLLLVLLCVAAGGASRSMAGQMAVASATTVGFLCSSNLILGHRRRSTLGTARPAARTGNRSASLHGAEIADAGRIGLLFSSLVLTAILMTTSAVAHVTEYFLPNVQSTLHEQLSNTLEAVRDQSAIGSSRYVRGSRIGTIRRHMMGDPASIALRAYATTSPGYLRGTVFDRYRNGRWAEVLNDRLRIPERSPAIDPRDLMQSGQGLTRLQGFSSRNLRRYALHEPDDARISSIEIHNDPLKGAVVFTPLATRWIEVSANSSSVTASQHDIIKAGVNVSNPYVCGVATTTKEETIDPQQRSLLLWLPPDVSEDLGKLASSLCASRPTAPAKANAISKYLRENFSYSLSPEIPTRRGDPIVHFLETKHAAHCEYFATATVLLLRAAGVPTRYVTGYVMNEFSEEELYWLARNRDAHAWAEAYDELTGHWFPIESTPGRTYESMSLSDANSSLLDLDDDDRDDDNADDSLLSWAWGWITSMRATDPLYVIFRFGQIPLFCVLVFYLWRSFSRGYDNEASPEDIKSRRMLQQIDRRLRRLSLIRRSHETLHQFASRIENAIDTQQFDADRHGEFVMQAARWYREYAAARYRGQMPTPFGQATAA